MKFVSLFFAFFLVSFTLSSFGEEVLVKVSLPSPRDKVSDFLARGFYIYEVGPDFLIGAIEADKLSPLAKEYPCEVLIPGLETYHARMFPGVDFGRFHSYQEIVDTFNIIAQNNPDLVRLDTIGRSVQNRVLLAMKITENAGGSGSKPRILFDATTHGNENIGSEVLLYLVRYLLQNYGVDPLITHLVRTREIWVIPIVNPDGMVARTRGNANGVDLNRDYGYLWDTGWGSPGPFSQPEIRAIRDFFQRAPFVIYITYHSGTEAAMWPWGYSTNAPYDSIFMSFLCQRYSYYTGYPAFQICRGLYETHGCSSDFAYGAEGAFCLAVELCSPHVPDTSRIDTICRKNTSANLEILRRLAYGIRGRVYDSLTQQPVKAIVISDPPNFPIYTDSNGYYFRYLHSGNYTIRVIANGYREKVIPNINVPADTYVVCNIPLVPDTTIPIFSYKCMACNIKDPADHSNRSLTAFSLGRRDSRRLSLGVKGWAVFDMQRLIINGPGNDFSLYEDDSDPEGCSVYVSMNWDGPWFLCGIDTGTSSYDLSRAGQGVCRYIRIADDGDGTNGPTGGFDLDAIEGVITNAPALVLQDRVIYDSSGNNNRRLDPGEEVSLVLILRNMGRQSANNLSGILRTQDPFITISDSLGNFGNIPPDSQRGNETDRFILFAHPQTPRGRQCLFSLYLSGTGYTDSLTFILEVGEITITDPIPDGDPAIYYAYDDIDTLYRQHPVYRWIELRNRGTQLPITLDDQTIRIPLPFVFKYYGIRYTDSLSVCSNGWISPIRTTSAVYTNQPLPDPTSSNPSAMICPNWDDLYPPYGNRIWYLYEPDSHRFVIEWDSVHYFSPNTLWDKFEVIVFDTSVPTPTGDNRIVFQYYSANNYTSNTVGIENHTSTRGICGLYNGGYHRAQAPLISGRAIAFETGEPQVGIALNSPYPLSGIRLPGSIIRLTVNGSHSGLNFGLRERAKITLYDVRGSKVGESSLLPNSPFFLPHYLASGVYFIALQLPNGIQNFKVVVLP